MMLTFADELQALSRAVENAQRETSQAQQKITLASITRQRIIAYLETAGTVSIPSISKALAANEATINHHVHVLEDARIIESRIARRGRVFALRGRMS